MSIRATVIIELCCDWCDKKEQITKQASKHDILNFNKLLPDAWVENDNGDFPGTVFCCEDHYGLNYDAWNNAEELAIEAAMDARIEYVEAAKQRFKEELDDLNKTLITDQVKND